MSGVLVEKFELPAHEKYTAKNITNDKIRAKIRPPFPDFESFANKAGFSFSIK